MRVFTLIVGIIFSFGLFFQSALGSFGSTELQEAAAVATLASLIWLIASAIVIALPLFAMILYVIASFILIGVGTSYAESYPDMRYWGWIGVLFIVSSFFGWRGKRKEDEEKRAEKERQAYRDMLLVQMASQNRMTPIAPTMRDSADEGDHQSRPSWMNR